MILGLAGLGTCWKVDDSGSWVDCDSWSNLFDSICWTPGSCQSQPGSTSGQAATGSSAGAATQLPPCGILDNLFATPGVNCQNTLGSVGTMALWAGVIGVGLLIVLEVAKH